MQHDPEYMFTHSLVRDARTTRTVLPKIHSIDELMRNPHRVVMAVRHRVMRVPHARQRPPRGTDDGENKRPRIVLAIVVTRDFHAIALKGNLRMRLRHGLHPRH